MVRLLVATTAKAITAKVVAVVRLLAATTAKAITAKVVAVVRLLAATAAKAITPRVVAMVRLLACRRSTVTPPQARGRAVGASFGKRHRKKPRILFLQRLYRWTSLHSLRVRGT